MFLGVIGVATVIVCILLGRYNRERVAREWDMALGRRMHESVDALERRCLIDRMMADDSWDAAWDAMVLEDRMEVLRLLDLAYDILETATVDRVVKLRAVRVCSRMAAALAPVPPLLPRNFRLPELRTLSGLGHVVHHLLVTTGQRFVVKARLIAFGMGLSLRAMRKARVRASLTDALQRFDAAKTDWKTLDVEQVEMVRALIVSLAATRVAVTAR